jgi:hypothetical protein
MSQIVVASACIGPGRLRGAGVLYALITMELIRRAVFLRGVITNGSDSVGLWLSADASHGHR